MCLVCFRLFDCLVVGVRLLLCLFVVCVLVFGDWSVLCLFLVCCFVFGVFRLVSYGSRLMLGVLSFGVLVFVFLAFS